MSSQAGIFKQLAPQREALALAGIVAAVFMLVALVAACAAARRGMGGDDRPARQREPADGGAARAGSEVCYEASGEGEFRFSPGPIFNNLRASSAKHARDELNTGVGMQAWSINSGFTWQSPVSPRCRVGCRFSSR
jgi:hypothetical protein